MAVCRIVLLICLPANDILSILIPVYDGLAAAFTVVRGIQSLRSMRVGATREELQDTLQYLLVEQGMK